MTGKKLIIIGCVCLFMVLGMYFFKHVHERKTYPQRLSQTYAMQQTLDVLSQPYYVDRIYKSMKGPKGTQLISLLETDQPELLWVTGIETTMADKLGKQEMPAEYMCHTNLDFGPQHQYRHDFENARLFTLSQGQLSTIFPKGFGIPVMSNDPFNLITQVLNLNEEDRKFHLRHKVKIHYIRDRDARVRMEPLFMAGAQAMKSVKKTIRGYEEITDESICFAPRRLVNFNLAENMVVDEEQNKFRAHWTVKPGRETVRTDVTDMLNLPYDTTIHHIAVHLHPFAQSLELKDVTTNQTIFKSNVTNYPDRIGLAHVESFSSPEGVQLYKKHRYEIISEYNNTTKEDQDSMAVMFLYLLAKD